MTLAVQVAGDGPAVVLANGIGVRHRGRARFTAHLRRAHRVICWDYRGIGGSATDSGRAGFAIIPSARLLLLPEATHFGPIEQPRIILAALDELLAR